MTSPICLASVSESEINRHLDSGCLASSSGSASQSTPSRIGSNSSPQLVKTPSAGPKSLAPIFSAGKRRHDAQPSSPPPSQDTPAKRIRTASTQNPVPSSSSLRSAKSSNFLASAPLAERLRPESLVDFVGQEHVIGKGSLLKGLLERGSTGSLILVRRSSYFTLPALIGRPPIYKSGARLVQVSLDCVFL